ncbi:MAG: FapA family protein, partial [Candidatus Cloacimonadota bacterium]|nr:FapA family protein [Candidatus Cloacimonadota bacterium]
IIAKGDIDIGGGIHGENTYVESSGKLSTKFIEFSKIKSKGQINVLRFCMGAEITCSDNIIIFGQEINLDTHGAMVECDIKVKKLLMCPVIGNSKGNANSITFGYDKQIEKRIINTRETIKGLKAQIQSLEDKASEFVDLRRKNILPDLKKLAKSIKDKVLGYIQDKKNIEKKLDMMQKIYDSSIQKRDKIVKESRIKVDRKIFPKFVLHCKGITKTYDHRILKSEFFFSFEKMDITLD